MSNITFVGGIHGVGKGKVCSELSSILNVNHLSASDVLKWGDVSPEKNNKLVANISDTQDRLIIGLKKVIEDGKSYLLDGHFCLLNSNGEISKIPAKTFQDINPRIISVVTEDIHIIHQRLYKRDGKEYDINTLAEMQSKELEHAFEIAKTLGIPFFEINKRDYTLFLQSFN
ncbi:MAG: AAA family ATPase [Flavobacteriales bacterium]|nr:AAA family ATPase [Flavobacteriales bacterium]